ncbi:immunoglobulin-like domain-containing protein [Halobacillus litoralis]|uniref:immunoglobulin-like domain-containing protein n=1 Tax=Halobacillus litoralis TaxID=45668 RepID=UPI00248FA244|nr:immunoglobulin-like domain-containing protein [Halobacillus litoralis]
MGKNITILGTFIFIVVAANVVSHIFPASSGSQKIPAQIGEQDKERFMYTERRPYTEEEVLQKTGYGPATGEGFKGIMVSPISNFSIYQQGEEQGTYVEGVPEGKTVRVQLISRTKELEKISLIEEKIYEEGAKGLVVTLPEERNMLYSVSAEMLDETGEVIDTIAGIVYVPGKPEINAKLSLDKDVYSAEYILEYKVTNWGPRRLSYGARYTIQVYQNGERSIHPHHDEISAFPDLEYVVLPGNENKTSISLKDFEMEEGKYRVIKRIRITDGEVEFSLAAEFEVEN